MELRKLTYFLAAAQTQNFNKAAELCSVAQPVLSRQIATLEAELGVELFKRAKKRVTLTPAGLEFSEYVKAALEKLQDGQQALSEVKNGERGTVFVGCVEPLAVNFLPPIFARLNKLYPGIRFQISVRGPDELVKLVEQGVLDFGLLGLPSGQAKATPVLVVQELYRDRLQLVIAPDHPLAQKDPQEIRLGDLSNEPLVLLREGFGVRRVTERIFTARGLKLQPVLEIDLIEGLKEYVKQGLGLTLLPTSLIRPDETGKELLVIPVSDLLEEFSFALIYRRIGSTSTTARSVIKAILATT
jgi:DNA-binding transcriptional LysR family regulator